jgi:hypothetical protein
MGKIYYLGRAFVPFIFLFIGVFQNHKKYEAKQIFKSSQWLLNVSINKMEESI